jgi:hypothetical protein
MKQTTTSSNEHSSMGVMPASTSRKAQAIAGVNLQITANYLGDTAIVCRRRFIWAWKKASDSESWKSIGLCMTDDNGMLFEFKPFLDAIGFKQKNVKIHKYSPAKRGFSEEPWALYGDAEDILALQQYLSEPFVGREAKRTSATEIRFSNSSLFIQPLKDGETLYSNPFIVEDDHLIACEQGTDYYFMFYPPHVVGRSMGALSIASHTAIEPGATPSPSYLDNVYRASENESLDSIKEALGLAPGFDLAGYKDNKSKLDNTGKRCKKGALIATPPSSSPAFGFGKFVSLKGIGKTATIHPEWFTVTAAPQASAKSLPAINLELPVTLEEHTARMSEDLALLDMTWSVIIESAKPFAEASHKVRSIAELIDIMRRYPGFNKRKEFFPGESDLKGKTEYTNSVAYWDREEEFSADEKRLIDDAFLSAKVLEDMLQQSPFTDQNPIFRYEMQGFYALIENLEKQISSTRLIAVLNQWIAHTCYGDADTFPYFCSYEKAPLFFEILAKTFQTLLSIKAPYEQKPSGDNPRTVGDAVYENILAPFEAELQGLFNAADASGDMHAQIADAMKSGGLIDKSAKAIFDDRIYLPDQAGNNGDLLKFIFSDLVLKKGVAGVDKCAAYILKAGTEYRTKMMRTECARRRFTAAFTYYKIAAGLQLKSGTKPPELVAATRKRLAELSAERRRFDRLSREVGQRGKSRMNAIAIPREFSLAANAVSAGIALFNLFDFADKLEKATDKKAKFDAWVGFTSSLNSFGAAAAGFTDNLLKSTDAVLEVQELLRMNLDKVTDRGVRAKVAAFADSAGKGLKATGLVFSVYGLYQNFDKSMRAARTGDSLETSLRWVQFGISTVSAATAFVPGGVLLSIALESANLAISGWIALRESLKEGVESLIDKINAELSNSSLFRSKYQGLLSDRKYMLAGDKELVHARLGARRFQIGDDLLGGLRALQNRLNIRYVDIDPIAGGAVLLSRGYSMKDIAFITMKLNRFRPVEYQFIEGFSELGVFDLRDSAREVALDDYEYPKENYFESVEKKSMFGSATQQWLNPDPQTYFRKHYSDRNLKLTKF